MFKRIIKYYNKIVLFLKQQTEEEKQENTSSIDIKNLDISFENFKNLGERDLVIAKMTDEDINKFKVPKAHTVRPLLIESNNQEEKNVNGYYLSSQITRGTNTLILEKEKYNLNKDSNVIIKPKAENLPYENIKERIDTLSLSDYKILRDIIKLYYSFMLKYPKIGSVIIHEDNIYLVYQQDNTKSYAHKLSYQHELPELKKDRLNIVRIKEHFFKVDFNSQEIFDSKELATVSYQILEDKVTRLMQNKKEIKYLEKKCRKEEKLEKKRSKRR